MTSKDLEMAAVDGQTPNGGTAELWQQWKLSGPNSRSPDAGRPNGSRPASGPAAQECGGGGRSGDSADADGIDACGLEAYLRQLLESLISLIDPDLAEIVWRAEILDQTTPVIASEMNLDEETVIARLRIGRRTLRNFVVLALLPSFERHSDADQCALTPRRNEVNLRAIKT